MRLRELDRAEERSRQARAESLLANETPGLSARRLMSKGQAWTFCLLIVALVVGAVVSATWTGITLVGLATVLYASILIDRIGLVLRSLRQPAMLRISDSDARALPGDELPMYTLLVPIFKEQSLVDQLVGSLEALDYPREKLDVKLLLEHDDLSTLEAVRARAPEDFEVVVVPAGEPRTKPRALNYGLGFAVGEFVTIYDAEDIPDPLQLRKAVVAFSRLPEHIGCLQAQLEYWNSEQNLITRWFGAEYIQWFRLLLPGLAARGAPIPLGGTSNHIRRDVLESAGAWDPYNVTEDADLGVRLHRAGYRCAVIDSVTREEANSDYVNWNNQRSRWYKGYLQTWLVHMRHPISLLEQVGWRGWFEFNVFVGGTPVLSVLNLVFWALTVAWFAGNVQIVRTLFPTAIYYPALLCLVIGNVAFAYLYILSARLARRPSLVWAAVLAPLYWMMMGIAGLKALWQLTFNRSFWEKTVHGLANRAPDTGPTAGNAAASVSRPETFSSAEIPALAHAIESGGARDATLGRSSVEGVGRALQITGLALLVFLAYLFGMSGMFRSGPGAPSELPVPLHPANGAALARLDLPRLNIDQVVVQGASPGELTRDLGHLPGSALPGAPGEAVIVGHRFVEGSALAPLSNAKRGDLVELYTGGGEAVFRVDSISETATHNLPLENAPRVQLAIATSTGGLLSNRILVVRADLVSEEGVHFAGSPAISATNVALPDGNDGWVLASLLCLGLVLVGARTWRSPRRLFNGHWGRIFAVALVVFGVLGMCTCGLNAVPITL